MLVNTAPDLYMHAIYTLSYELVGESEIYGSFILEVALGKNWCQLGIFLSSNNE